MYRRIKYDLEQVLRVKQLDFNTRVDLMQNVKNEVKALENGKEEAKIEIKTPPEGAYNLHRMLVYTMR
jgi:hypothetical protein